MKVNNTSLGFAGYGFELLESFNLMK